MASGLSIISLATWNSTIEDWHGSDNLSDVETVIDCYEYTAIGINAGQEDRAISRRLPCYKRILPTLHQLYNFRVSGLTPQLLNAYKQSSIQYRRLLF